MNFGAYEGVVAFGRPFKQRDDPNNCAALYLEKADALGMKASQSHRCVSRSHIGQTLTVRHDGLPLPRSDIEAMRNVIPELRVRKA